MRGLIIKDLLFIKNNYKSMSIMFIGSFLLSIALGNYLLAMSTVPVMLLASSISTFQTDEFYNTEAFTLTYPLSRTKIVSAKYLFTLVLTILSLYLGVVIYLLIFYIINPGYNGINIEMIKALIMLEFATLTINSIFFPVIYKFGCEKSRLVLMAIVMLLIGIASVISVYTNYFAITLIDLEKVMDYINQHGILLLSILVTVMMSVSYGISILVFKRKDY